VGAVGRSPDCFDKKVVEALLRPKPANVWQQCWAPALAPKALPPPSTSNTNPFSTSTAASARPIMFALSNPKTQAEATAKDVYEWSGGRCIFGSGTSFEPVTVNGRTHAPGQVNNVYIFPGLSFGAAMCRASGLPDKIFLDAAEAVAQTLSEQDLAEDRVVPHLDRIREVGLNVATATVLGCQRLGLASRPLGTTAAEVREALRALMWTPALSDTSKSKL